MIIPNPFRRIQTESEERNRVHKPRLSRRHPASATLLLLCGLIFTGLGYAAFAPRTATATEDSAGRIEQGKSLFLSNCASCHGINAVGSKAGIALAGVGAAAVDFQVSTGRMPMSAPGVQAPRKARVFDEDQTAALAAYVASLAPGPAIPSAQQVDPKKGNAAKGGDIFRVNCAMCHNAAGAGGALTRGKYAPSLKGVGPTQVYEAMLTGPQSMPVFNDTNLTPAAKRDVIAYLKGMEEAGNPGGNPLGSLGPVPEGLFAWVAGLGILIGAAVWLGQKSA